MFLPPRKKPPEFKKKRKEKKEVWQEAHEQKLQEHDQTRKEIDSRNSSHNSLTPPPHNILEKQQDATRTKKKKSRGLRKGKGKHMQSKKKKESWSALTSTEDIHKIGGRKVKAKSHSSWTVHNVHCGNTLAYTTNSQSEPALNTQKKGKKKIVKTAWKQFFHWENHIKQKELQFFEQHDAVFDN